MPTWKVPVTVKMTFWIEGPDKNLAISEIEGAMFAFDADNVSELVGAHVHVDDWKTDLGKVKKATDAEMRTP